MEENLMDRLKNMLSDPDAMQSLSDMLGGMGNSRQQADQARAAQQLEMMAKVKEVMERVTDGNDPRINLLTALRPYLRSSRAAQMDRAIRMIQMTRLTSVFKDLR